MAIYDCGSAATLLLSNTAAIPDSYTIGGVNMVLEPSSTFAVQCSGQVDVVPGVNMAVKLLAGVPPVFDEQFLLGLAGLLCGALLSYVIAKTAL